MKKYLLKMTLIAIACVVLLTTLNILFTNNNGRYTYMMMLEMYNCEDNIDVVFLGSSHVYRTYDVEMADSILNETTYNAGSSGQLLDQSYYLLREICKTNQVKTVYLDTYFGVTQIASSKDENSVFLISDYMKLSPNKLEYLYRSGGVKTVCEGLITARRNMANTDILSNLNTHFIKVGDYSSITYSNEEYRGKGFVYSFDTWNIEKTDFKEFAAIKLTSEFPMSEFSYNYIVKIIEYCQLREIELVLVDQPMPKEVLRRIDGYDNYVDFMYRLCEEYNILYLNFNLYKGDMGITAEDFKDAHHLNGQGAEKYTEVFCNVINQLNDSSMSVEELFEK